MITKQIFLDTLYCPTYGWYSQNIDTSETTSLPDQLRMEEGLEVHNRARKLFPDAISINGDNLTCAKLTKKHIRNKAIDTLLEATFIADNYITKADILVRSSKGWDLYEVKSSTNNKPELIEDMAYTTMVARRAGLKINSCKLLLVSKNYRLGMRNKSLFEEYLVTDEVFETADEFLGEWEKIAKYLNRKRVPKPKLTWSCRRCELYSDCYDEDIQDTIFEMPYLNESIYNDLIDLDVFQIADIPEYFSLSGFQQMVREAVIKGNLYIDKEGLRYDLESILYPAYYLDFETTQTCLPLYKNTAPYTQIPTQYSIHTCSSPGKITGHLEYLADDSRDCRRELAERLIRDCRKRGSIIVYTSFEKTMINRLIELFPDLEDQLSSLIDRMVDLHKIIRNNYYDPQFRGSTSIKKVLPVVVSDLSYDGMAIGDGMLASAVFAYMAKGKYNQEEIKQLRKDLLEYCKLDTLAMVRLHEKLEEYT